MNYYDTKYYYNLFEIIKVLEKVFIVFTITMLVLSLLSIIHQIEPNNIIKRILYLGPVNILILGIMSFYYMYLKLKLDYICYCDFDIDNLYYDTVNLKGYVFYKNGKILNYNQLKHHIIFNRLNSSEVTYENIPVMVVGYTCKISGKFIEKNIYDAYIDTDLKFEQFKNQELLEYFTY
jgi:hypothetical protein